MNETLTGPGKPRYDVEEDLANDIKRHDNPHHPSKHAHDKGLADADDREKEDDGSGDEEDDDSES